MSRQQKTQCIGVAIIALGLGTILVATGTVALMAGCAVGLFGIAFVGVS